MPEPSNLAAAVRIMSRKDYQRLRDDQAFIMDLRKPSDFADGHLEGARSFPAGRFQLRYRLAPIVGDRPVVLIAQSLLDIESMNSEVVASGLTVVGTLTGNPATWLAKGLPVTGWRPLPVAEFQALPEDRRPMVVDITEAHEGPTDPHWPTAIRRPLSDWSDDWAWLDSPHGIVLLGPKARAVHAAVQIMEVNASPGPIYRGQINSASGIQPAVLTGAK